MIEDDELLSFANRESKVLNNLVDSLAKDGLATVEEPKVASFSRDLIKEIVREKVITLDQLKSTLTATNLLNNGVVEILKSPDLDITIT